MREDWTIEKLGSFISDRGNSIDPRKFPNEDFELYSVPSHSDGKPEIIKGEKIGSSKQFTGDEWVLLSRINPHLNRSWVIRSNSTYRKIASSEWVKFPPNKAIFPEYLGHYLTQAHVRNYMCANVSGVGGSLTRTNKNAINELEIILPPLPEQRAIVAKIEGLFSDLDKGIADLKKAQEQLKVYRQAVLKKAFEGELTKEWREQQTDLLAAEELLEQIKVEGQKHYEQQLEDWKQAVNAWEKNGKEGKKPGKPKFLKEMTSFSQDQKSKLYKLDKTWVWTKSGQIFSYVTSGSRGWAKYYSDEGGIFIRITNLNFDTLDLELTPESIQYVKPPASAEGLRTKVFEGDFLFSITGYLGMFAIAPYLEEAYVNQHISLARPSKLCNSKFLGYWIIAKTGGHFYLNKKSKGATKAGLGLDDIIEFPIPLCPIEEQHQIVQEIESRLSVCDQVEESITESLEKAQALRQSILKKAFEGTLLTEGEVAACKAAPDYEPASVLLERIKNLKKDKAHV
ncbi:MAG: restriction endonuclease subunit S [Bacteroidota bacterium]